jgi:hypothetical protein
MAAGRSAPIVLIIPGLDGGAFHLLSEPAKLPMFLRKGRSDFNVWRAAISFPVISKLFDLLPFASPCAYRSCGMRGD